ncbi:MAG: class I SAM-dependent methyltransferase [Patescibacteria group bacterium]|nr:class I SAM-dependent methyltransferase [Patescibacteria group bacterium]
MKKKVIEEYNDKLAPLYDKVTKGEFKWIAPKKVAKKLLSFVKRGDLILDLGCGTGQSAESFIKKGCKVIGIDISSEMLKIAGKKHKFWKLYKYDIEKGLKNLGFKRNFFDVVIVVGVLEFVKNFKKIMKEIVELTKPGGYIAFTYELLIKNRKLQSKRVSPLGEGLLKPIPKLLLFKVYRYTSIEIQKILNKNKIKKICNEKFIGYFKTKKKIPIYYQVLIGRKC